jgi:hypothetical protein
MVLTLNNLDKTNKLDLLTIESYSGRWKGIQSYHTECQNSLKKGY